MEKWKIKYPCLTYKKHLFTEGLVIILDKKTTTEIQKELSLLETKSGKEIVLLKAREMTYDLDTVLKQELSGIITKENSLFLFPGQGAEQVEKLSKSHIGYPKLKIFAKRFWVPGDEPAASVGVIILPKDIQPERIKIMIVLDDVISSGETLRRIYEQNFQKFKTKWIAGSWVIQAPRMKNTNCGVTGYDKIITAIVVEGPQGKRVPVNSLSSLLGSYDIAQNYAERHFKKPSEFLRMLSVIKSSFKN